MLVESWAYPANSQPILMKVQYDIEDAEAAPV